MPKVLEDPIHDAMKKFPVIVKCDRCLKKLSFELAEFKLEKAVNQMDSDKAVCECVCGEKLLTYDNEICMVVRAKENGVLKRGGCI